MLRESDMDSFVEKIVSTVTTAGLVAVELQEKVTNLKKIGANPKKQALTQADLACQEIILKCVLDYCPEAILHVEEDTNLIKRFSQASEWGVVVDPLDGTLRYLEGDPSFGISVAIVHNDVYIGAIVGLPKRNIVLSAIRGLGTWLHSDSTFRVDRIPKCQRVVLCHDKVLSSERQTLHHLGFETSTKCGAEITTAPVIGSAVAGIRPEYVSLFGRIGALITIEAGGFCCDKKGQKIEQITLGPMSSLIVADNKETAELIVSKSCCH